MISYLNAFLHVLDILNILFQIVGGQYITFHIETPILLQYI